VNSKRTPQTELSPSSVFTDLAVLFTFRIHILRMGGISTVVCEVGPLEILPYDHRPCSCYSLGDTDRWATWTFRLL